MVVNIYINLCKHKIIFVDFVFRFLEFELVFLLHTVINITVILTMRLFGYYIIPEINKDGGFKIILVILNQLKNICFITRMFRCRFSVTIESMDFNINLTDKKVRKSKKKSERGNCFFYLCMHCNFQRHFPLQLC